MPKAMGRWAIRAARIRIWPRVKQLSEEQGPERFLVLRATWVSGKCARWGAEPLAGASPPTLTTHRVATASANQMRATREGSDICVFCHCQPSRLKSLKPSSIQWRMPYQVAQADAEGRSVRISQGCGYGLVQHANNVPSTEL